MVLLTTWIAREADSASRARAAQHLLGDRAEYSDAARALSTDLSSLKDGEERLPSSWKW